MTLLIIFLVDADMAAEERVLDSPRLGQAHQSTRFALTIVAPLHSYDRAQYSGRHAR